MHLALTTYGSYIRKQGERFIVKVKDDKINVSAKKVESIHIHTGCNLSSNSIKLAMDYNIPVVFFDKYGNPFSRVWHSKMGSTTKIRINQLKYAQNMKGLKVAVDWIIMKTQKRIKFIKKLASHRPKKKERLNNFISSLKKEVNQIKNLNYDYDKKKVEGRIRGLEGSAGKIYFNCLSYLLPKRYEYNGRSMMPAKDKFNAFLNYSYGVLYSLTEKASIIAGLDPFIGFLHSDNYNKKSFVFDLVEPFRPICEEVVFYLFSKRKVNNSHCDEINNGYTLNKKGKKLLITSLNKKFDEKTRYRKHNMKYRDTIQKEAHFIANSMIEK